MAKSFKILLMARLTTQQEIIMVNGTGFAKRQYAEKKPSQAINHKSQPDQFKQACWNGDLKEIMPELFFMFPSDVKLFMWQMRDCENIFTMEMSEEPTELDFYASIDPYCFMEVQEYN